MLEQVRLAQQETSFQAKRSKRKTEDETRLLENNFENRAMQEFQKASSAFIDYPTKGLRGDVNSNFYEFLTMGIVPYLAGSAMFMLVFNCVNKFLMPQGKKIASSIGNKMALGVVLYGVLKNLSKNLVTKPVKAATGVDTEMPYQNKVYSLPKGAGKDAEIDITYQQRKVYDSKEFFRKDLLKRDYFDEVAKKLGLGENLNDSISETTPIIQNIVATTNTAKSLASYCWAGLGVMLAVQDSWVPFFNSFRNKSHYVAKDGASFLQKLGGRAKVFGENTWNITKQFLHSAGGACKELWNGKPGSSGFMKHSGKVFTLATAALTTFLTANTIIRAKHMAKNTNKNTIDKTKESTVI